MRAAEQAPPSSNRRSAARVATAESPVRLYTWHVLMAVLATLALLFVWRPTVLRAQAAPAKTSKAAAQAAKRPAERDTTTTTHVVKAGETLWSLATRYYGDGHQWRALARRNGIPLTSDTALRVGAKLLVPSKGAVAAATTRLPVAKEAAVPAVATTPASSAPAPVRSVTPGLTPKPRTGALAAQTANKGDASGKGTTAKTTAAKPATVSSRESAAPKVATAADVNPAADTSAMSNRGALRPQIITGKLLTRSESHIGIVGATDLRSARARNESPTVFVRVVPDAAEAAEATRSLLRAATPAPRRGEFVAAPYPLAESRWAQAGRVLGRFDAGGGAKSQTDARLQLADEVEISAPAGTTLSVGDQLVAVRMDAAISPTARVGVPTGVLQVTRADAGKPIRAYVRSQTGVIEQGQALFPSEGAAAAIDLRLELVSGADVSTTVSWTEAAVIPSLQSYLVLGAGEAQGVKAGDQFALVRGTAGTAEERIAVVRVVRATAHGSAVVVVQQSRPEIAVGVTARRIARVP